MNDLESKIEKLEERIEELEERLQSSEYELEESREISGELQNEVFELTEFRDQREGFGERCFNAGHDCKDSKLKGWLNFKMVERI